MNLLYSYFDTSFDPPRQLTSDLIFSKGDTIAPVLLKVYTGKQHNISPTVSLGINPYPVAILSAQFTFLPLIQLRTERHLIPLAPFNVPMIRSEQNPNSVPHGTSDDINDSVGKLAGYIASGETYSSLKSELLQVIREKNRGDAYSEFKRIEQRSHRMWLGMELPDHDSDSVMSGMESMRKVRSGKSPRPRSVSPEFSKSSKSFDVTYRGIEKENAALVKGQLRREVCAWWGRKASD